MTHNWQTLYFPPATLMLTHRMTSTSLHSWLRVNMDVLGWFEHSSKIFEWIFMPGIYGASRPQNWLKMMRSEIGLMILSYWLPLSSQLLLRTVLQALFGPFLLKMELFD